MKNRDAFKLCHHFNSHPSSEASSRRLDVPSVAPSASDSRRRGIIIIIITRHHAWLFICLLLLLTESSSSSSSSKSYTTAMASSPRGGGGGSVCRRLVIVSSSVYNSAATTVAGRTLLPAFHSSFNLQPKRGARGGGDYFKARRRKMSASAITPGGRLSLHPSFIGHGGGSSSSSSSSRATYNTNKQGRHCFGLQAVASSPSSSSHTTTSSASSSSPLPESEPRSEVAAAVAATADDDDTIFALSSGSSTSGQATAVAVLRISGPRAVSILRQLLLLDTDSNEHHDNDINTKKNNNNNMKRKTAAAFPKPRIATLRTLYHPTTRQPLDQALILFFPGPKSFTGEDVVELHCHGSRAVTDSLLTVLAGTSSRNNNRNAMTARYAEPGEFTQRAFSSGKLDILQVEALADLLAADTSRQQQQALAQLDGQLSQIYAEWRSSLITALAHAEAIIDFGDDEHLGLAAANDDENDEYSHDGVVLQRAQDNVWGGVVQSMQVLLQKMRGQLQDARRGELVRQGLQIAIVGPPNAGKSSLFNLLACQDVAIVSPTAGTTRDVLTVTLNLGGVKCLLQDTAGVRASAGDTSDLIEREGMKRAIQVAAKADVVVAVIDAFAAYSRDSANNDNETADHDNEYTPNADAIIQNLLDEVMLQNATLQPENVLLVRNKSDLRKNSQQHQHENNAAQPSSRLVSDERSFDISCQTQDGIDKFLDALTRKVVARVGSSGTDGGDNDDSGENEGVSSSSSSSLITRARHRQHVQAAVEALDRFVSLSVHGSMTVDLAAEELRLAASELGRITGAVDVEDILDKLFADFCIGK